ncbi:MAG TPA: MarP family serine protease [Solirubrobacteraceae bacterium]|nr:MarP family serine protease [Solirubrobacteraceae bacterium]
MTKVDWLIVAFSVLLAMYGYIQGFIMGVLSLAGFAVGAFLGTRLGPLVLPGGSHSQYAPLFGLVGALLAGAVLASGFEGIGARARVFLRLPGLRLVDGVLGAALTASVALGIAWIVGAIAFESTGSPVLRSDIQRSAILRGLNELLPPAGPILHALDRIDPLPSVHGPSANVPAPPPAIVAEHKIVAAGPSVLKVLGTACGLGIEGSGWVAAPDVVVTNAHVVAGEADTSVELDGNPPEIRAEVIDFDPRDDIAVLRVPGLHERVLPIAANPKSGTPAAILGYPLDGGFDLEPGRIGQTEEVSTEDAYGNGPVLRSITALRGRVRPGNSGGPMVDKDGQVVATVFAAITGSSSGPGGFAVPNSLVRTQLKLALARTRAVGTGQCASG